MSEIARHAAHRCPAHEELGFALARDLGTTVDDADVTRLELLAGQLPREVAPLLQLEAVAGLLAGPLRPDPVGPLLLPRALRGDAHPAAAVLAAVAAAARAGYEVDVVGSAERLYLAHPEVEAIVVGPVAGLRDGRELGVDLRWCCAHESAACVLDRIVARAERDGDLATSLAAAALRLALPLDDSSRARHEREHSRLLARLN